MSLERVIKALIGLGLTRSDAEVYVYLAKKGPQEVMDLAKALNYVNKKINASLKNLQTKGLVSKDRTIFSALPFEEALDLLIKMEKEQAKAMRESKKELLTTWETKD
jgi:predicted transcriptional regulator